MLTTKNRIIKSTTTTGNLAKLDVRIVKTEEDSQMFVCIDKYILTNEELDITTHTMKLVKTYKDKYLYFLHLGFKLETYIELTKNVYSLLKNE